jgi:hypothetical protein
MRSKKDQLKVCLSSPNHHATYANDRSALGVEERHKTALPGALLAANVHDTLSTMRK